MRQLFKFHGGVHPPTHKAESTRTPIAQAKMPSKLVNPLHQHVGNRAVPVVQVGERVLKGQVIGRPDGRLSSAVHASTSGTVSAIDMQLVAHFSGLPDLCITLIPDGKDEWIEHSGVDYKQTPHTELRHLLREAGVLGLGITDAVSRKIVGAHIGDSLEAAGCLEARDQALAQLPTGMDPIHHSDRGCQYCCHAYVGRLRERELKVSMTEVTQCYENALAERVNGILKQGYELDGEFRSKAQAKRAFEQAVWLYNHRRPHLKLEYRCPAEVQDLTT